MQNQADNRMMENLYWWGVPTLFRCPHETNFENCDIGLIGVPIQQGMVLRKEINIWGLVLLEMFLLF